MSQEFTKYQGHVNNPKCMAEYTPRCSDRAISEMGPTQLNIPRDHLYGEIVCEIPKPMRVNCGAVVEKTLNESQRVAGQCKVPGHPGRRRRGDARRSSGVQSTGRTASARRC